MTIKLDITEFLVKCIEKANAVVQEIEDSATHFSLESNVAKYDKIKSDVDTLVAAVKLIAHQSDIADYLDDVGYTDLEAVYRSTLSDARTRVYEDNEQEQTRLDDSLSAAADNVASNDIVRRITAFNMSVNNFASGMFHHTMAVEAFNACYAEYVAISSEVAKVQCISTRADLAANVARIYNLLQGSRAIYGF